MNGRYLKQRSRFPKRSVVHYGMSDGKVFSFSMRRTKSACVSFHYEFVCKPSMVDSNRVDWCLQLGESIQGKIADLIWPSLVFGLLLVELFFI